MYHTPAAQEFDDSISLKLFPTADTGKQLSCKQDKQEISTQMEVQIVMW